METAASAADQSDLLTANFWFPGSGGRDLQWGM